ncbi:uncharacterized protein BXZ73DRAFT_62080, partial [Epithele typhae]|uniref:uncharacterized protein n=1 Tax=Epithele typhae TaxID=378194 RepID=UPI002007B4E1
MPLDARARPQWYVDVAVELSRPGHVLQWHRSQHPDILRYLFPSMDEDRAKKVVKFNSFYVDVNAHIHRLAGFRYQPRSPVNNIVYANIYTTDKTVIYQLHPGVFRPRTGEDLLPRKINALDQDMDSISAQFHSAAGLTPAPEDAEVHSDDSDEDRPVRMMPSQDGAARAEVRVRVSAFSSVLRVFTQQELENFVVTYRNNEWWLWKFLRTCALRYIVTAYKKYSEEVRITLPSLALGAATVYMLNALFRRPQSYNYQRILDSTCAMKI